MNEEDWVAMQSQTYATHGYGETGRSLRPEAKGAVRYAQVLKAKLPGMARILDLGCNDGSFCKVLADRGHAVTGVDLPDVIERAKEDHPELDLIGVDISVLDWPEGTFDAIVAFGIIEHIVHDFKLLTKALSWLNPRGQIFLTTPLSPEKIGGDHLRFYPPISLSNLMQVAGFKVSTLEVFQGIDEYLIVGEKNGKKSVP